MCTVEELEGTTTITTYQMWNSVRRCCREGKQRVAIRCGAKRNRKRVESAPFTTVRGAHTSRLIFRRDTQVTMVKRYLSPSCITLNTRYTKFRHRLLPEIHQLIYRRIYVRSFPVCSVTTSILQRTGEDSAYCPPNSNTKKKLAHTGNAAIKIIQLKKILIKYWFYTRIQAVL